MKNLFTKLTMLFVVLSISTSLMAQMTLEYNLDLSAGTTITLPLYGTVNVTVDWGDGNSESFTTTGDKSHTYATGGTKTVSISGTLTQFGSGGAYNNADKLVKATSFGSIGLTSLSGAFYGCTNLEEVSAALPSAITSLSYTFHGIGKVSITGLNSWDVSNITYMYSMFKNASNFNQDLGSWNIGSVTNTAFMFFSNYNFNQDISSWDMSQVVDMGGMFRNAYSFNQPIYNWNVSSVNDMEQVFLNAETFNQPIGSWDVSSVTDMSFMFREADAFDQNLSNWNVSNVSNMTLMFGSITLSTANYNSLLIGWEALDLYDGVNFHGGNSQYSPGAATNARAAIIADDSWTITDGGVDNSMLLEFNTDLSNGTTVTLPLYGTVNVTVDWGDGNSEPFTTTGDKNHTYATGGTKTVSISGILTQFGNGWVSYMNARSLVKITSFGNIGLISLYGAFYGATYLEEVPTTLPATIANLSLAFGGNSKASITGLSSWNVSNVIDMSYMFLNATDFNQSLNSWDVSNVTNMRSMFNGSTSFNQPVNSWDVSDVTNMGSLFYNARNFNMNISSWNVGSVIYMSGMFSDARLFNQDIGNWDVSAVTDMSDMFSNSWAFNHDISGWNVSSVIDLSYMFSNATSFNQALNTWDVVSVTNMMNMFAGAYAFNQSLDSWNVSGVTDMRNMFNNAITFNQEIGSWNVSNVTNMSGMLLGTTFSTANYNSLLMSWAELDLYNGIIFHGGGNNKYSPGAAATARAAIIADDSWTIFDGGQEVSIVWAATDDELAEWNIALSWQGGIVPTINDNVVIPSSQYNPYIAPGNEGNCRNLTIDNGASLDLNSNFLDGSASLITNGTTQNNGTITAQRYTTAGQWHCISSPLSGATANSLYLNGNPDVWIKEHNESTNAYTYLSELTTPLGDMKGFFTWIDGSAAQTFNIVGDLRSGEVGADDNVERSDAGADYGWNFVGNPFTSAIDWNASSGWTKTNVDNTIYIYNSPNWAAWNGTTGTNGGSQYIAMGQGFFVNVTEGNATGTLKMDDGVKVHNSVAYLKQTEATIDKLIRLEVSGNGYADEAVILLSESATEGFDSNLDAHKLFSFNTDVPQIYSTANDFMAINGLPLSTTAVPLDVRGLDEMEMTISLTENTGFEDVFLEDNITGIQTNLIWENYSFTYSEDITDRFTIYFTTVGLPDQTNETFNIYAFKNNVNVVIPNNQVAEIFVYNLTGQTIAHSTGTPGINKIAIDRMGYYVVKVVSNTSVSTKKVFIK